MSENLFPCTFCRMRPESFNDVLRERAELRRTLAREVRARHAAEARTSAAQVEIEELRTALYDLRMSRSALVLEQRLDAAQQAERRAVAEKQEERDQRVIAEVERDQAKLALAKLAGGAP